MSKGNEPAFPTDVERSGPMGTYYEHKDQRGLTKREYISALCLQGFCADSDFRDSMKDVSLLPQGDAVVKLAVSYADALLAELNKEGAKNG